MIKLWIESIGFHSMEFSQRTKFLKSCFGFFLILIIVLLNLDANNFKIRLFIPFGSPIHLTMPKQSLTLNLLYCGLLNINVILNLFAFFSILFYLFEKSGKVSCFFF